MLFVIDMGNTNICLGLFEGNELTHQWRVQTKTNKTADEYGVQFQQLFNSENIDPAAVESVIIASVVPPLNSTIENVCKRYFNQEAVFVEPGIKTGMPILYDNPREVGSDRVANGVGAFSQYNCGLIVVDFGTATTFDVITPKGEYLGGAISPGIVVSTEALYFKASKLPRPDIKAPRSALGKTTVESMASGIVFGYVALVDGLVDRLCAEIDFEPKIIATGGLAPMIAMHSERIEEVQADLTLQGLRIIHERNQRNTQTKK